jgi:hypothetical protein
MDEAQAKALRAPFPDAEIGKLPRIYCGKCKASQFKACDEHKPRGNCKECGQKHSTAAFHLDYIGHAETTDRLLSVDPEWNWGFAFTDEHGAPMFDRDGGMWINLTIAGVTRLGYGDAQGKSGGNAVKEVIGDAIRNAAMRFGVGLDLWRKTDKVEAEHESPPIGSQEPPEPSKADLARIRLRAAVKAAGGDASGIAADFLAEQGEQLRTSEKWAAIDHLAEDWEAIAESKVKA